MSHVANSSSGSGKKAGQSGFLIDQFVALKAVLQLSDHAVEEVALCGGVPVSGVATAPVVRVGPGRMPEGGLGRF
jgi:hypothetical protein